MDHIHHVCRLFTNICWAFPLFIFTSIIMHMILQYKSVMFEEVWLNSPSCFHWLRPSSLCQYIFSSADFGFTYIFLCRLWVSVRFLSLKMVFLCVITEPFHFLFCKAWRMTTTFEILKRPVHNKCYSMDTIHTSVKLQWAHTWPA